MPFIFFQNSPEMKINFLRANHHTEPIGYDLSSLSISWIPESNDAKRPNWSRVEISTDRFFKDIVSDSGKQALNSLDYQPNIELAPCTRYYWRVTVEADNGETATETSFFETGLIHTPLSAKWITTPDAEQTGHFIIRKQFTATKGDARLYCAAAGIFEATVNGKPVTDEVLLPGYHPFNLEMPVMTFDISNILVDGDNVIELHVGRGWYGTSMGGWETDNPPFGSIPVAIAEVRVDGKIIAQTDDTWDAYPSPVVDSGIYLGEIYDTTRESLSAIDAPSKKTVLFTETIAPLSDRFSPPIRRTETLPVVSVINTPKGETILDFGQEMTGWFEVRNRMPAGTTWTLEAGEILDTDGNFFRDNLRKAKALYTFTSSGPDERWIRPHFTFYGFRYLRLTGYVGEPDPKDFRGVVIHSDLGITGSIQTPNSLLNRFFLNTLWGQRGNFLDVPTDCPQRDERLGWTGDAQAFSGTACFHMYTPAFYGKFIHEMILEQPNYDGGVPFVVPSVVKWYKTKSSHSSSAWGDAATVIPWNVYTYFGDKSLLRKMYPAMKMWVGYIERQDETNGNHRLWQTGFHFGDWLALDNFRNPSSAFGGTDAYYIASAYYAFSTELTLRAAEVLGEFADAEHYRIRLQEIKQAIRNEYFSPNGRCTSDTQTAYVVALAMDLVPTEMRKRCADILAEKIRNNKNALETGFVGTYFLCRVLGDNGHADVAYDLLLREEYPSWLYEVKFGATTVWERWNGQGPAARASDMSMNSFNHYAYGSVEEWVYRGVCGLNPDPSIPGFRHVFLRPLASKKLGEARLSFLSPCGVYESEWKINADDTVSYRFRIPFGCTATLEIPGAPDTLPKTLEAGVHTFTV